MKQRIFILYYVWSNTKNNHSGMEYFVKRYKELSEHKIILLKVPLNYSNLNSKIRRIWREYTFHYLRLRLKNDDKVFFNEYLSQGNQVGNPVEMAGRLKSKGVKNKFVGLVHLPGSELEKIFGREYIHDAINNVDKIVVFGSSLKKYLSEYMNSNVETTFHYVQTDYYKPLIPNNHSNDFHVLCTGNLLRDYDKLFEIIKSTPEIKYVVCFGTKLPEKRFVNLQNAEIFGYLKEDELLKIIQKSSVHLSVLYDTVGSNAITTTMACGLPQIVSDVGSIRDYCNESNAFFCNETQDFVKAIHNLFNKPETLIKMSHSSRKRAEELSIANSIIEYDKLFQNIKS